MTPAEIAADLSRPWRHGEHLDLAGAVIEGPLVLDGLTLRGVDLSRATLTGGLSARGARFMGLCWLRGAAVDGDCDLAGASFRTDLRADGLVAGEVSLSRCRIEGVLSLARARVAALRLDAALVMANATLEGAEAAMLDLSGATILGGLWTPGAWIGRLTGSAEVEGRVRS
jgi:uncharacterized protein YjbI with pentapeptide repeats